jgi:hypothetical protein
MVASKDVGSQWRNVSRHCFRSPILPLTKVCVLNQLRCVCNTLPCSPAWYRRTVTGPRNLESQLFGHTSTLVVAMLTTADDGSGGHIFKDQMHVKKLSPVSTKRKTPNPIVFIHGQGQTGKNFLNKPDGGRSWSSRFLQAGHTVYIVDQTLRGRSA